MVKIAAETQSNTLDKRLASTQAEGSFASQVTPRLRRGTMKYMFIKLRAINAPDTENVHPLCRDKVTSHGRNESNEATDAPSPNRTSRDGRAQHNRVPSDVNREK